MQWDGRPVVSLWRLHPSWSERRVVGVQEPWGDPQASGAASAHRERPACASRWAYRGESALRAALGLQVARRQLRCWSHHGESACRRVPACCRPAAKGLLDGLDGLGFRRVAVLRFLGGEEQASRPVQDVGSVEPVPRVSPVLQALTERQAWTALFQRGGWELQRGKRFVASDPGLRLDGLGPLPGEAWVLRPSVGPVLAWMRRAVVAGPWVLRRAWRAC